MNRDAQQGDLLTRDLTELRAMWEELSQLTDRVHEAADKALQALNEGH